MNSKYAYMLHMSEFLNCLRWACVEFLYALHTYMHKLSGEKYVPTKKGGGGRKRFNFYFVVAISHFALLQTSQLRFVLFTDPLNRYCNLCASASSISPLTFLTKNFLKVENW